MSQPHDLSDANWRVSGRSGGQGQCVEVAGLTRAVGVRDSKDRTGPVLQFDSDAWRRFASRVKADLLDLP